MDVMKEKLLEAYEAVNTLYHEFLEKDILLNLHYDYEMVWITFHGYYGPLWYYENEYGNTCDSRDRDRYDGPLVDYLRIKIVEFEG